MKGRIFCLFLLIFAVCFSALSVSAAPSEKDGLLSPGLLVLAEKGGMARASLYGGEISFEKADFCRALNLSSIKSLTITKAPSPDEGRLMLGNTVISDGHDILVGNISLLRFVPASKYTDEADFRFCANGSAYDVECSLYYLDKINYAPTLSLASSASLEESTYRGVSLFGVLSAYDPDGDELTYEIASYPKKGSIVMVNDKTGEYRYTPLGGFSGKDSFSYVVRDKYGNYSASAEVSVTVKSSTLSLGFDDMEGNSAHAAAIALTEKGIMSGTKVADGYYFDPEATVSRAEFVVMAMKAKGVSGMGESDTVFADNEDIPTEMRGYISAAYELGYVKGSMVEGELCFLPNESISRAEASVIVGRMIDAVSPTIKPVIADSENIPAWAEASVNSLVYMGILDTEGGAVGALDDMTRADTAKLLCGVIG